MPDKPTVDLRSDTVTKPCPKMYAAMTSAEVDDNVLGHDPTVAQLEARAASLTGKEAALFVPSGCMANLISVMAQAPAGSEIIVGKNSHIHCAESGAYARLAQVNKWPIEEDEQGRLAPNQITDAIHLGLERPHGNSHQPTTSLLCLENSHNYSGGTVQTKADMHASIVAAKEKAPWIKVHLDGARLFNAAVSLGTTAEALAAEAHSVSFCLSKGLGAPIGSMICGTKDMMLQAQALQKMLGGGMRQVGVLAACGLVALEDENIQRLAETHTFCRRLGEGIQDIPGIEVDLDRVQTNIIFFSYAGEKGDARWLVEALEERGIRSMALGNRVRMVTHRDNSEEQIEYAVEVISKLLR